jgi:hypothetical protein
MPDRNAWVDPLQKPLQHLASPKENCFEHTNKQTAKMAHSDNESELSEISQEQFRVLEEYYETNHLEPMEGPNLEDELDDQGFSAAEIAAAICKSRQEQDRRESHSAFLEPSGSASQEIASEVESQSDRKRKHSQAYDDGPTKRRRIPPENLIIQDQQNEGPSGERLEFEVMETPSEHLSAMLISPTGQSAAQAKSNLTTAQPAVANPSLSHDHDQIANCNHVDLIPDSSMAGIKSASSRQRRTFEDSSQDSDDLQSKDADYSKGLSHFEPWKNMC